MCRPRWIDAEAARAHQLLAINDELKITTDPPSKMEDERSPERGERARQVARLYRREENQSDEEVRPKKVVFILSLVAIAANNEKGTPPDIAPPDGEPWLRTRPTTYPGRLSAV